MFSTADGKLLYVADAGDGKTYVYRIQADGSLSDRRLIAPVGSDGMTLDEKGKVYLTRGVVHVYRPDGKNIATIEVPEAPANVCFGAGDRRTLFITARKGLYSIRMNVRGQQRLPAFRATPASCCGALTCNRGHLQPKGKLFGC